MPSLCESRKSKRELTSLRHQHEANVRLFIVSKSGRSTLLRLSPRRQRRRSTKTKHDEPHVVREERVGRGSDEEHAGSRNSATPRSVGPVRRRGLREEGPQSTGAGRVKIFRLFPPLSFLLIIFFQVLTGAGIRYWKMTTVHPQGQKYQNTKLTRKRPKSFTKGS